MQKDLDSGIELKRLQDSYLEKFSKARMPTPIDADYRYTSLAGLDVSLSQKPSAVRMELNGSLPKGVVFTTMDKALKTHPDIVLDGLGSLKIADKFALLAAAKFSSGVFLYVPDSVVVNNPLRASCNLEGSVSLFSLLVLGKNSSASFYEDFSSSDKSAAMSSCLLSASVGQGAHLSVNTFQDLPASVWDFQYKRASVGRDARMEWNFAVFGGRLSRLRNDTYLEGQGADCRNTGVFLSSDKSHIDITTNAYHMAPSTTNRIQTKGVCTNSSSSVYRGLIKIAKQAQKTDSYLSNNILLLDEQSLANSIPALEIDADDVKASHGATIGQIDDEQLFYLRSRGLPRKQAEQLIVEGFFDPVLRQINMESIKEKYMQSVSRRLQ